MILVLVSVSAPIVSQRHCEQIPYCWVGRRASAGLGVGGWVACGRWARSGPSMGQQPHTDTMNPAGASAKANARASGYHQKAMAEIHNSLLPFAKSGVVEAVGSSAASTISTLSTTSGVSSASGLSSGSNGVDKELGVRQAILQLINMGYTEVSI